MITFLQESRERLHREVLGPEARERDYQVKGERKAGCLCGYFLNLSILNNRAICGSILGESEKSEWTQFEKQWPWFTDKLRDM